MAISLFEHNRKAYDAAVSMLHETGKAAIVHPTGTGKSFIGFKLCENNPAALVCWLSPSEYIFKTQLENLAATGADVPDNLVFYTYAKLMLMGEEEIAELQPDYIVLDEFHRCGAEMWGKGVARLLALYGDVPVLGLSATNVRYLDNQRDMADELFDGNIASEMTLGEAIVRGILNAPTYIISVYSYQKDLQRYQRSINSVHLKGMRKTNEQYLDELRRALEQADGLDVVFYKHMTDRFGKYIIFCSNKEHMDEMIEKAPGWFGAIDTAPHIYRAYSDDPATSRAFADFKTDKSAHLKLLYCIDMLNEGIHVEGVSGVILLRPTVSPIIYKQQIGRALSAGQAKQPVILDVVNNFENLFSTDALTAEMNSAVSYYRDRGESDRIVNERFTIIDETQDCRRLFDQLQRSLSVPWETYFVAAKAYYAEFGNLEIPYGYKTADGLSLGSWIHIQRRTKAGILDRPLSSEQIAQLESIGMVWKNRKDIAWDRYIRAVEDYRAQYGDLDIPMNYVTTDGLKLGGWIIRIRQQRAAHLSLPELSPERIAQLDALGMIWNKISLYWEQCYAAATEYYVRHGNLEIPKKYVAQDGIRLGDWIHRQRLARHKGGMLSPEQISRLDAIGMQWYSPAERYWRKLYDAAKVFYGKNGHLDVSASYMTPDNLSLGQWIRNQRAQQGASGGSSAYRAEHIELLNQIGMLWNKAKEDSWDKIYALAKRFYEQHGHLFVPVDYTVDDYPYLYNWVSIQRRQQEKGCLPQDRVEKLNAIGMRWQRVTDYAWESNYQCAKRYYETHGHLRVPEKYISSDKTKLGQWIKVQRQQKVSLSPEQVDRLEAIGIVWDNIKQLQWMENYEAAKAYFEEHGHLNMPMNYRGSNGRKLRDWLNALRRNRANGAATPTAEQIALLDAIGMDWAVIDRWAEQYKEAKKYYEQHGDLNVPAKFINENGTKIGSWVTEQRKIYKRGNLSEERIRLLDQISMIWDAISDKTWDENYRKAFEYYQYYGNLDVPVYFTTADGLQLGRWLDRQRRAQGTMSKERLEKLNRIGIVWEIKKKGA